MKQLENYYRNLCEQLQQQIAILEGKIKDKKKGKKNDKKEAKKKKMADKDYDGDGEIESSKDEYFGSKDKAIKKKMAEKKKMIKEGREIHGGIMNYGGFPRVLNETKFSIPANPDEAAAAEDEDDLGTVGIDEFYKLMTGGSHPMMAGQKINGPRGVPAEIRKEALHHLNNLRKHPQGKIEGYGDDHPAFKEAKAAHDFFTTHFPQYGVEDQIAQDYGIR